MGNVKDFNSFNESNTGTKPNMTPKEKAEELYVGYWYLTNDSRIAKKCALIAVDEVKNTKAVYANDVEYDYWQEVKNELNFGFG